LNAKPVNANLTGKHKFKS